MAAEDARFPVDDALLVRARRVLGHRPAIAFVVGGAGAGKSTVCAEIGRRTGIEVLDVDARLYGDWFGRLDARRHPAGRAWASAPDPLAWQLSLDPDAFAAFHAATTAESLDLLADDLEARDPDLPLLVDGGFGRPAVLAAGIPASRIACIALAAPLRRVVWTGDPDRRGFLDEVAATVLPDGRDPIAAFLALDDRLHEEMVRDARAVGIPVLERGAATTVDDLAGRVASALRIGPA
jgi:hypothetical protein